MAGFDALFGKGKEDMDLCRRVYRITVISAALFFGAAFVILKM